MNRRDLVRPNCLQNCCENAFDIRSHHAQSREHISIRSMSHLSSDDIVTISLLGVLGIRDMSRMGLTTHPRIDACLQFFPQFSGDKRDNMIYRACTLCVCIHPEK